METKPVADIAHAEELVGRLLEERKQNQWLTTELKRMHIKYELAFRQCANLHPDSMSHKILELVCGMENEIQTLRETVWHLSGNANFTPSLRSTIELLLKYRLEVEGIIEKRS